MKYKLNTHHRKLLVDTMTPVNMYLKIRDKFPNSILLESSDYALIAPKLVGCALDVAIPEMSIELPIKPKSLAKITSLKEEFGLGASIDRIMAALGWV